VSDFWLPAVEVTDDLVADLAAKSGAAGAGREAFRFSLEFADQGQRCTIGTRWRGAPGAVTPDDPLDPQVPWITFAIVESGSQLVLWALDAGDEHHVGEGWKIAARIPKTAMVSARASFPPSGFAVTFTRRRKHS
jgi:hypothetical protein